MNTVVFVLVVMAQRWVPTIEFSSLEKCQAAIVQIDKALDEADDWRKPKSRLTLPICVRIEK